MGAFAKITNGPSNTTGIETSFPALIFDQQNNIVSSVGSSAKVSALQTSRQVTTAQTALTTITTAQTFWTKTLGAGELNVPGRTYTLTVYGIYTSPVTAQPYFTFVLNLGGVAIATIVSGAVSATASTNMPFQISFTFTVVSTGSSGTVECHSGLSINLTANTPAGVQTITRTLTRLCPPPSI